MTARTDIFRADLSGTAFGGTPTWTDLSAYILAEGQGEPVSITWGRQDEESDVTPSTMSIVLDNVDGRFTPDRAASPYYPHLLPGFRANFRQTVNGVTYDRFDGYCDEIAQAWPGGSEGWSVVRLTFTDVTARLAQDQPLRSAIEEAYRHAAVVPRAVFSLDEPNGATTAGQSCGVVARTLSLLSGAYGTGSVAFGQDAGRLDGAPGVTFGPASTGGTTGAATVLNLLPISSLVVQRCCLVLSNVTAIPANPAVILVASTDYSAGASPPRMFNELRINTSGFLEMQHVDAVNNETITGPFVADGQPHAIGWDLSDDASTNVALVADGVKYVGTSTYGGFTHTRIQLGGRVIVGATGAQLVGTLSSVLLDDTGYGTAIADLQTFQNIALGALGERGDQAFTRVAGWGGITTTGLPTAQSTIGVLKTVGVTALDVLKNIGRTENGPVFADGTGALTFQARNFRYQPTTAVTLNTANHDVDDGLNPRKDRQGLINDITVTRDGGSAQRVQNSASQSAYGRADAGSYTVSSSTDDDALQAANWQIGKHKDAALRVPSLTVDLLTQPTTAQTQAVLALGISKVISLTGLPANAPATSMGLFVEGGRETIGLQEWSIGFYTSPVTVEAHLWVLEDPTFGVIDSTNLIAF